MGRARMGIAKSAWRLESRILEVVNRDFRSLAMSQQNPVSFGSIDAAWQADSNPLVSLAPDWNL